MNRRPFNRSAFNRQGTAETVGNSGIALLKLSAIPVFANRDINSLLTSATLVLDSGISGTNVKYGATTAAIKLSATGQQTKVIVAMAGISDMVIKTYADQAVQGESVIDLEGLILRPGDELIINTCDMTVMLNGQNGTQYFSPDSEFFALLSGDNEIIYSDGNTTRNVTLDIIWKDRWL